MEIIACINTSYKKIIGLIVQVKHYFNLPTANAIVVIFVNIF